MRSFLLSRARTKIVLCIVGGLLAIGFTGLLLGFESLDDVLGFVLRDAVSHGNLASVDWLLKHRPSLVFNKSNLDRTALYCAAASGHKEIANLLLNYKAHINAKDWTGFTPLHVAAFLGDRDMAALLLSRGADVNAMDNHGGTPLYSSKANVVALLLAYGSKVDARDDAPYGGSGTPLESAAAGGDSEKMQLLLAHGADVNAKDKLGDTPLHCAAQGNKNATALLLAHGATVDAKNSDGDTPLHLAAMMGYENEAVLLLVNHADVNARDDHGLTPMSYAEQDGHKDLAELLRRHGVHE